MMNIYIATVWVEGGRLPDRNVQRHVLRLREPSEAAFRSQADALMAGKYVSSNTLDIQLTFGPIGLSKHQDGL